MFQAKVVLKIQTYILCPITLFEIRFLYKIMWKHTVQPVDHRLKYGARALQAGKLRLKSHIYNT